MLDSIAQKQADAGALEAFLQDVARGRLARRGYQVFTLLWDGRTAPAAVKAKARAAIVAGFISWPSIGPNVVATLTDDGREVLA